MNNFVADQQDAQIKTKKQLAAEHLNRSSTQEEGEPSTPLQPPVKASLIHGTAPMRKPRVGPEFQAAIPEVQQSAKRPQK